MRRTLLALAVAALVVALAPAPAPASPPNPDSDVRGPACADVVDGAAFYSGETVAAQLLLAVPGCPAFSYTLEVFAAGGGGAPIASQTLSGDASEPFNEFHQIVLSATVPSGTGDEVCVVLTTASGGGRHPFDRAPDAGCATVVRDTTNTGGNVFR